jgi:NMT1-like family
MITRRAVCTLPAVLAASRAQAQNSAEITLRAAQRRVDEKVAALARQLAAAKISVVTAPGFGPLKNMTSLLEGRDAEVAMLPADVLAYLRGRNQLNGSAKSLRYIGQLYSAPVHVLARQHISNIAQLSGQNVGLGAEDSASYVTATQVFKLLDITVRSIAVDDTLGLQMLRRGELLALVYVGEAPAPLLFDVNRQQDGVQLLPMTLTPALSHTYLPAQFTIQDYPLLIGAGEAGTGSPIPTIAVPMLLAVYNWPPSTAIHRNLSRFAIAFSSSAPTAPDVVDWVRFVPDTATRPVARNPPNQSSPLTTQQRETLFREFEKWRQQQ